MIYILETELNENKSIFFALQSVYGIGKFHSKIFCRRMGFSLNLKVNELTSEQLQKLVKMVENNKILITTDLKKSQSLIIKNLIDIKTRRGIRRIQGLPVRGQRTHTNAKSARKFRKISFKN